MSKPGMDTIPRIDVCNLSGSMEDMTRIACELKEAFTKIGFAAVINHNISQKDVSAFRDLKKYKCWTCLGMFHIT